MVKPLKSEERQKMSNLNSPLKPTKVKAMKISVRKINVNGEKLSKDIIWPLKPLKSKERQKMSILTLLVTASEIVIISRGGDGIHPPV